MPRLSKRKRDERRFGKPERLADMIAANEFPPSVPTWSGLIDRDAVAMKQRLDFAFRTMIAGRPVVSIDNVAEYYYATPKTIWEYTREFPACRPPFPVMFIEARRPMVYRDESGARSFDLSFPSHWGCVVEPLDASRLPRHSSDPVIASNLIPLLQIEGVSKIIRMTLAVVQAGFFLAGYITYYVPIDSSGEVLAKPATTMPLLPGDDVEIANITASESGQFMQTALLALSFMNCKNIALSTVEPDARRNRDRQKAGLKPFLRYHTIDIEPMKTVLRSEGGIETNGLKKALHICRGHFAHYTEDKPLFGRPGMHGAFWMPAHVRGSARQGVVVSDYAVHTPAPEPRL